MAAQKEIGEPNATCDAATRMPCLVITRRELIVGSVVTASALVLAACGETGASNAAPPSVALSQRPISEPRSAFVVPVDPESIAPGSVFSIPTYRVTIVRDDGGYYAVYLICTHLGCTPVYTADVVSGATNDASVIAMAESRGERHAAERKPDGFLCPCHGGRFFVDGTNFVGPPPRPMDWVNIAFNQKGQLVVDRAELVVYRQPGDTTAPQWRLDPTTRKSNGLTLGV